ncbi:MAG: LuxR C-terminal-related transcriptional regulator [Actinomycetes bacterium]
MLSSGLRVVVCDDHRVFTDALVPYLIDLPEVGSVEAVYDADEALRLVRKGADLLVLDLGLDDVRGDGLTVVEALSHMGLAVKVLILSGSEDVATIARALQLGAHGFCGKDAKPETLLSAIRQVLAGGFVLPSHLAQPVLAQLHLSQAVASAQALEMARLTPREQEVLRLLSNGRSSRHIAGTLGLSQHTVRTHLQHIMGKLDVHSQLQAAAEGRRLFTDGSPGYSDEDRTIDLDAHPRGLDRSDALAADDEADRAGRDRVDTEPTEFVGDEMPAVGRVP